MKTKKAAHWMIVVISERTRGTFQRWAIYFSYKPGTLHYTSRSTLCDCGLLCSFSLYFFFLFFFVSSFSSNLSTFLVHALSSGWVDWARPPEWVTPPPHHHHHHTHCPGFGLMDTGKCFRKKGLLLKWNDPPASSSPSRLSQFFLLW